MAQIIKTDYKEVNKIEAAARAAELSITGVGINKQVQILTEEFGYHFSRRQVERLKLHDVYVRVYSEYTDNIVKATNSRIRKEAVDVLAPLITPALVKSINEGNTTGIQIALKILGTESVEPTSNQAQSLTVVLPGATAPKEKQVVEIKEDDNGDD